MGSRLKESMEIPYPLAGVEVFLNLNSHCGFKVEGIHGDTIPIGKCWDFTQSHDGFKVEGIHGDTIPIGKCWDFTQSHDGFKVEGIHGDTIPAGRCWDFIQSQLSTWVQDWGIHGGTFPPPPWLLSRVSAVMSRCRPPVLVSYDSLPVDTNRCVEFLLRLTVGQVEDCRKLWWCLFFFPFFLSFLYFPPHVLLVMPVCTKRPVSWPFVLTYLLTGVVFLVRLVHHSP